MENYNSIKGFKDYSGEYVLSKQKIIYLCERIVQKYCFIPIETPIVEEESIFVKSVGEESDIISKEVFRLQKNSEKSKSLVLRPEQTSSVMRFILKNNIRNGRFYSYGPMFRHENPQIGRLRQFFQFNVELINDNDAYFIYEFINVALEIKKEVQNCFSINDSDLIVRFNYLGSKEEQENYSNYLKEIISTMAFSSEAKRKAEKNPLRVLDTKNQDDQNLLSGLKTISNFYGQISKDRWGNVLKILKDSNCNYLVDEFLVRGLDYYTGIVLEIEMQVDGKSTVIAGGEYDNLANLMTNGKINIKAGGFAVGVDRIAQYLEKNDLIAMQKILPICTMDSSFQYNTNVLSELRKKYNAIVITRGKNLSQKLQNINKDKDKYHNFVVLIGKEEENTKTITVKYLQGESKNLTTTINEFLHLKI